MFGGVASLRLAPFHAEASKDEIPIDFEEHLERGLLRLKRRGTFKAWQWEKTNVEFYNSEQFKQYVEVGGRKGATWSLLEQNLSLEGWSIRSPYGVGRGGVGWGGVGSDGVGTQDAGCGVMSLQCRLRTWRFARTPLVPQDPRGERLPIW